MCPALWSATTTRGWKVERMKPIGGSPLLHGLFSGFVIAPLFSGFVTGLLLGHLGAYVLAGILTSTVGASVWLMTRRVVERGRDTRPR